MADPHICFNVHSAGQVRTVTQPELSEFAQAVGLDHVVQGRYSWLFALQFLLHIELRGINPYQVIAEIRALEDGTPLTGTKPATLFVHPPLKGFWHKHFFCARYIPKNIINALSGGWLSALVNDVLDPMRSSIITHEMIKELSHRVVNETLEKRKAHNKLTGEWIVFAQHGGRNYYLCLATHSAGDRAIYDQTESLCFPQFPFLKTKPP